MWGAMVLLVAYVLPNHYSPWSSVHQELGALLALGPIMVWASFHARWVPLLTVVAVALSFSPLLQLLNGQLYFSSDGWMAWLYLVGFAIAVSAGACYAADEKGADAPSFSPLIWLWTAVILAALVSVNIQLHQWLSLGDRGIYIAELPPAYRPFGNLAQPNQLATLLLFGLMGVLFLWERQHLRGKLGLLAALTLVSGLVMTGSRSVLLTLVWLLPAYGLMRRRCHLRTTPTAIVCLVGFYALLSFSWPSINNALLLPSDANTAVERMTAPGIRTVFWRAMADAIGQAPWLGYGWGQIGSAQVLTTLSYPPTYSSFDSAHNLFLDMALWAGLPVALGLAVVVLLWFGWQVYRCRDPSSFAVLAAVGVVFSHAMVEFPLSYAYFLLPVGFWMGCLSAVAPTKFDVVHPKLPRAILRSLSLGLGSGALALSVGVIAEYFPFEADWALMRYQHARIGNLEVTQPPEAIVLTSLREFLRFSRTDAKSGMSAQDLEWMRRVSERYPYAAPMYKYALAQALNGRTAGYQLTLRRLCSMQTVASCESAKQDWAELTQYRFPQLAATPFPAVVRLP